jgi:hypothetical protein
MSDVLECLLPFVERPASPPAVGSDSLASTEFQNWWQFVFVTETTQANGKGLLLF